MVEAPLADAPVVETPLADAPVADAPVADAPATEAPETEASAVDVPAANAPVAADPVVDADGGRAPAEEPVGDAPAASQPADDETEASAIDEKVDAPVAEAAPVDPTASATPAEAAPSATEAADTPVAEATTPEKGDDDASTVAVAAAQAEPDEPEAPAASEPSADGSGEAISIRGLVKHFGDNHAVDGISLSVPAGTFYGVVGPNGAGKTTTLSIVAGLLRADAGSVTICGIDQAADPLAAKRVMGVLPDRLRTFDRLTGRQLLHYYGLLRGLASDVIEKRVADLARAFDLGDALGRVVSDYSAGMTKKVMLAGAMIHSPRVLVLDEPFESVDPVSSAVILDILRAYVAHGGTVILSSHGMDLVERVCSRVAIIVGGEVLAEGTVDEVRAGQTLEARFVELSGGIGEVEGLEWLHTFSD
ncbi:ATP-binding cassette domain-containing protein [uncultured Microbacterium sp.]|uniref:ABC transporter ATP-binding protein n=1 Tax=uncultured Microbacterium sp. TaxID=191216 RepID=UPI0028DD07D7|nr:ATP-binding cassette domain-containing protein [uncultured Microbacterium sp.]